MDTLRLNFSDHEHIAFFDPMKDIVFLFFFLTKRTREIEEIGLALPSQRLSNQNLDQDSRPF